MTKEQEALEMAIDWISGQWEYENIGGSEILSKLKAALANHSEDKLNMVTELKAEIKRLEGIEKMNKEKEAIVDALEARQLALDALEIDWLCIESHDLEFAVELLEDMDVSGDDRGALETVLILLGSAKYPRNVGLEVVKEDKLDMVEQKTTLQTIATAPETSEGKSLTDEQCDEAIRRSGLWTLACTVPQNLALLRGLCRESAHWAYQDEPIPQVPHGWQLVPVDALNRAVALLKSAHLPIDNVWERFDVCEALTKAQLNAAAPPPKDEA